jgi:hypothetical protein
MANAKNVRVEYHLEATVNMGNFENQKPGYTLSADVPPGVHPGVVKDELKKLVEGWLEDEIKEIRGE